MFHTFVLPYRVLLFYSTFTDSLRALVPKILPEWKWDKFFVYQEEPSVYRSKRFQLVFKNEEEKAKVILLILKNVSKEKQAVIYVDRGTDMTMLLMTLAIIKKQVTAPEVTSNTEILPCDSGLLRFKSHKARLLITCASLFWFRSIAGWWLFSFFPIIISLISNLINMDCISR